MGNQQLILVVLGTIVVAIAVAVGVTMFRAQYHEAVGDEIYTQLHSFVQDAMAYYEKPATLGGGGGSFTGFSLPRNLRKVGDITYSSNLDGQALTLMGTTQGGAIIVGVRKEGAYGVRGSGRGEDVEWRITWTGAGFLEHLMESRENI